MVLKSEFVLASVFEKIFERGRLALEVRYSAIKESTEEPPFFSDIKRISPAALENPEGLQNVAGDEILGGKNEVYGWNAPAAMFFAAAR